MKYIKTEDNVTKTYEVLIDEERLKALMVLLDRDCYIRKVGNRSVKAHFRDEAEEKIKGMVNYANLPVNESYKLGELIRGPFWYHGLPLDANYQAIYKDSVELVKKLDFLLKEKDDEDYEEFVPSILDEINNYGTSDEFLSFDVRVEKADIKVSECLANNDIGLIDAIKEYSMAVATMKLNPNYDFDKLYALYQEVLKCFKYNLVEEKIKYTR